jgi:hypothetical protein
MSVDNSKEFSEKDTKPRKLFFKMGDTQYSLPNIALLFILLGVLLPSVMYSVKLRNPTPADLLVAICISVFSSLLFLWIMDVTSVLRFRSEWVSKSIYGAVLVSILGTSVAVYKDAFSERKYPFEGHWELSISSKEPQPFQIKHNAAILFSENAQKYWGYSDFKPRNKETNAKSTWINIEEFNPQNGNIRFEIVKDDNSITEYNLKLKKDINGKMFKAEDKEKLNFNICRTK